MPSSLLKAAPQFIVQDVVISAECYRDVLGFKILGLFPEPPVHAMVARDGVEIHFGKADADEINKNESLRAISVDAYIWTNNIDELFEELKSRNANIVEPIVKRIYGPREFVIKDCNGYKIAFGD